MALSVGIVGQPNPGKSSLFNALSRTGAPVAAYPFTTIDPHRGVVPVPDPRLDAIASVTHPDRVVPATVEFVDIAGLVRGASRGEGLGNQFLAQIRDANAIAHVVRCFPDPEVPHVEGAVDPVRDIEIVETELALADLAAVERELERARIRVKAHEAKASDEVTLLEDLSAQLQRGTPARRLTADPRRADVMAPLRLLTVKPVGYGASVAEQVLPLAPPAGPGRRDADAQGAPVGAVSAEPEAGAAPLSAAG